MATLKPPKFVDRISNQNLRSTKNFKLNEHYVVQRLKCQIYLAIYLISRRDIFSLAQISWFMAEFLIQLHFSGIMYDLSSSLKRY